MRSCASACALLLLLLGACGGDAGVGNAPPGSEPDGSVAPPPDGDRDGLCDFSEDELGTDPRASDSDGDGLPDLIELVNGFDATDPLTPADEQLGYLEARREGSADFPIRATVEGDGQGISGDFQALTSIYADGLTAADFFVGAAAVSALPVDGVRSIDEGSAHFAAVLGKTRLVFSLRFQYPYDLLGEIDCARTYPFRYVMKSDDGRIRAETQQLLMLMPAGATSPTAVEHCLPHTCQ